VADHREPVFRLPLKLVLDTKPSPPAHGEVASSLEDPVCQESLSVSDDPRFDQHFRNEPLIARFGFDAELTPKGFESTSLIVVRAV
jgi:hypothetical protein